MRYQNGILSLVVAVLGTITLMGMAYTDQFPQAAHAESVGFEALAHHLFTSAEEAPQTDPVSVQ